MDTGTSMCEDHIQHQPDLAAHPASAEQPAGLAASCSPHFPASFKDCLGSPCVPSHRWPATFSPPHLSDMVPAACTPHLAAPSFSAQGNQQACMAAADSQESLHHFDLAAPSQLPRQLLQPRGPKGKFAEPAQLSGQCSSFKQLPASYAPSHPHQALIPCKHLLCAAPAAESGAHHLHSPSAPTHPSTELQTNSGSMHAAAMHHCRASQQLPGACEAASGALDHCSPSAQPSRCFSAPADSLRDRCPATAPPAEEDSGRRTTGVPEPSEHHRHGPAAAQLHVAGQCSQAPQSEVRQCWISPGCVAQAQAPQQSRTAAGAGTAAAGRASCPQLAHDGTPDGAAELIRNSAPAQHAAPSSGLSKGSARQRQAQRTTADVSMVLAAAAQLQAEISIINLQPASLSIQPLDAQPLASSPFSGACPSGPPASGSLPPSEGCPCNLPLPTSLPSSGTCQLVGSAAASLPCLTSCLSGPPLPGHLPHSAACPPSLPAPAMADRMAADRSDSGCAPLHKALDHKAPAGPARDSSSWQASDTHMIDGSKSGSLLPAKTSSPGSSMSSSRIIQLPTGTFMDSTEEVMQPQGQPDAHGCLSDSVPGRSFGQHLQEPSSSARSLSQSHQPHPSSQTWPHGSHQMEAVSMVADRCSSNQDCWQGQLPHPSRLKSPAGSHQMDGAAGMVAEPSPTQVHLLGEVDLAPEPSRQLGMRPGCQMAAEPAGVVAEPAAILGLPAAATLVADPDAHLPAGSLVSELRKLRRKRRHHSNRRANLDKITASANALSAAGDVACFKKPLSKTQVLLPRLAWLTPISAA